MGFMMLDDYTAFYTRSLYGWFPGKDSALTSHERVPRERASIGTTTTGELADGRDRAGLGVRGQERTSPRLIQPKSPHRQPARALRDRRTTSRSRSAATSIPA
ncbi:MAG: hypothetical protein MZU84_06340 [Sphingobacterium sp.]|nr:hypothetical protein [Sphingobacterium sp.]